MSLTVQCSLKRRSCLRAVKLNDSLPRMERVSSKSRHYIVILSSNLPVVRLLFRKILEKPSFNVNYSNINLNIARPLTRFILLLLISDEQGGLWRDGRSSSQTRGELELPGSTPGWPHHA